MSPEQMTRVVNEVVIMIREDKPGNFQFFSQRRAEASNEGIKAFVNDHSLLSAIPTSKMSVPKLEERFIAFSNRQANVLLA